MTPATSRWAWASGHLEVTNIVLALPVAEVRAMLPPSLTLAPQSLTPPGTHPVVLMFGQHSHVRPWFLPFGAGSSYHEWIVATPLLEWRRGAMVRPCSYMSRLYLNSLVMVVGGWLYGYPKKLSSSTVTPASYNVRTFPGGAPLVTMTNAPAGPAVPFTDLPGEARLALFFEQPFYQRLGPFPWLASRMWFALGTATAQPMTAQFSITGGCAPGLEAMSATVGSIADGIPGAFHLSCDWTLSRMFPAGDAPPGLDGPNPPQ